MTRSIFTTAGFLFGLLAIVSCVDQQETAKRDPLAMCTDCHGSTGISYKYDIPHLAGQNHAYIVNQLHHFRTTAEKGDTRGNATMAWHVHRIDERDYDRLAMYFSEQACVPGTYTWRSAKVDNACTTCHGANGRSTDPNIPNLAGQKVPYMQRQILAFQNGARGVESKNRHTFRINECMGPIAECIREKKMSTLYYFNAMGCR